MATASLYDQWQDSGLAFSEEEVRVFNPKQWAEAHVLELASAARTFCRLAELPDHEKPALVKDICRGLLNRASALCKFMELDGFDEDEARSLPPPSTTAGKKLTKLALEVDVEQWVHAFANQAEVAMTHVVSLGRVCALSRTVSGWSKKERSLSNKLANQMNNELQLAEKFRQALDSNRIKS